MHTFEDILQAKKHLTEQGYDFNSEFSFLKIAELMAEFKAKTASHRFFEEKLKKAYTDGFHDSMIEFNFDVGNYI